MISPLLPGIFCCDILVYENINSTYNTRLTGSEGVSSLLNVEDPLELAATAEMLSERLQGCETYIDLFQLEVLRVLDRWRLRLSSSSVSCRVELGIMSKSVSEVCMN